MTAFKNSFFQFSALFYHICSKGSYFINIHFSLFACPYYEAKISLRGFSNKKKEEIAKFISSVRGNLVEHQYLNNLNWKRKHIIFLIAIVKMRSENMQQVYRRTPMPKCDLLCNFIEITLRHGCSPGHLLHIFRTHFQNIYGGLLLAYATLWRIAPTW